MVEPCHSRRVEERPEVMIMSDTVAGRRLRPRSRRLRRAGSGSQPWSRRRRSSPITPDPLTPLTAEQQVRQPGGGRPLGPEQGNVS